jgi:four helix bundle protein
MGMTHHRDLEVWQLAHQIRGLFLEMASREAVRRDLSFCDQTNRAANSACRNIAEGFYRRTQRSSRKFLNIARGSLGELLDSLDEARQKRYVSAAEFNAADILIGRTMAATQALRRYLLSTREPK